MKRLIILLAALSMLAGCTGTPAEGDTAKEGTTAGGVVPQNTSGAPERVTTGN